MHGILLRPLPMWAQGRLNDVRVCVHVHVCVRACVCLRQGRDKDVFAMESEHAALLLKVHQAAQAEVVVAMGDLAAAAAASTSVFNARCGARLVVRVVRVVREGPGVRCRC